jgi:hypothetical protein
LGDKSINTTCFYLRDRAISITQNIYILPEPMLHTTYGLELVITPLRNTATSLGNNIFLVCSGDNHTIQYWYRNMSMIDNEAQDKTHDTFIGRTQERPEGCIILENSYKINVTFRHQPNPIFNSTTYSRQVWDRKIISTQHYFSFSQAAAPDVFSKRGSNGKRSQ